jgi:hypothetical protein
MIKENAPASFVLSALVALLANLHIKIFEKFSFVWTDMDQLKMWVGVNEIRDGNIHMLRYYGQDYGSMLEAWLATPFVWVDLATLLPIISYALLLTPYVILIVVGGNNNRLITALFTLSILASMPSEYIMIGSMPRDMVTGVAISSLAFLIRGTRWRDLAIFAFFLVIGWSFNANAAIIVAVGLSWKSASLYNQGLTRKVLGLLFGVSIALMCHRALDYYYTIHSELIVHHKWPIIFDINYLIEGLSNIDRHFSNISPYFHHKGSIYVGLIAVGVFYSIRQRRSEIAFGLATLVIILIVSLAVTKVHDASTSIFFSYERMFLALPVSLLFLFLKFRVEQRVVIALGLISIGMLINSENNLNRIIEKQIGHPNTVMMLTKYQRLRENCEGLEQVYLDVGAEAVIYGPGNVYESWILDRGCPCISEIKLMVRPEYERKTWDLIKLDQPGYQRILWFSDQLDADKLKTLGDYRLTRLTPTALFKDIYLLEGENINPMEIYKNMGFESVNYNQNE